MNETYEDVARMLRQLSKLTLDISNLLEDLSFKIEVCDPYDVTDDEDEPF